MSYYSTTDVAARRFAWVTLKPVTGRTHQLRVHMQQLGNPIIGDPRYFNIENWQGAPGLGDGLHLHARRIRLPLQSGKILDVSAPLPPHMVQSSRRSASTLTAMMLKMRILNTEPSTRCERSTNCGGDVFRCRAPSGRKGRDR